MGKRCDFRRPPLPAGYGMTTAQLGVPPLSGGLPLLSGPHTFGPSLLLPSSAAVPFFGPYGTNGGTAKTNSWPAPMMVYALYVRTRFTPKRISSVNALTWNPLVVNNSPQSLVPLAGSRQAHNGH